MSNRESAVIRLELTVPSLLGVSKDQAAKQRADVKHAMHRLFRYAQALVGKDDARHIWTETAKPKRGAPKGSRNPERDRQLLALYDEGMSGVRSAKERGRWPRRMSLLLDACSPGGYGASAAAIQRHVKRLAQTRDHERRAAQRRMRKLPCDAPLIGLMSSFISDATLNSAGSIAEALSPQGQEFPAI
jgi:hypothetical protein